MEMQVKFYKLDEGRLCAWIAELPKRKPFQGTTMASGRDLPHDLAQFVVEAALGLRQGFWNMLANGATFRSVAGRRRTQPGQQLISSHAEALNEAEHLANAHITAWRTGEPTPVCPALDEMYSRWQALSEGEEIRLEWSTERLPQVAKREGQTKKTPRTNGSYARRQ